MNKSRVPVYRFIQFSRCTETGSNVVPGRLTTRKTTFRSAANKITCVTHIPTIFPAVSTDDPDSRADRKHQRAALSKKKKYRRVCVHPWGREKTRGGRRKRKEGVDSARDPFGKKEKKNLFSSRSGIGARD